MHVMCADFFAMVACRSRGTTHVFAASDRPTIVYSANNKLLYSNLNESEVGFMASFNTPSFPDSLAIVKEESMTIGSIDDIQVGSDSIRRALFG